MNPPLHRLTKAFLSGAVVFGVPESAKRDNTLASLVHPLPLVSVGAFLWFFAGTRDTALIAKLVVTVLLDALTMRLLNAACVRL